VAAAAVALSEEQAPEIVKAAASAAPKQADKIAAAVAKATPKQAVNVTRTAVTLVPAISNEIVESVVTSVPIARQEIQKDGTITRSVRQSAQQGSNQGVIQIFNGTIRGRAGTTPIAVQVTAVTPGSDPAREAYGRPR
jgi:hypothetical protein